uniref:Uncharacterized protein n=1 Tax=Schistocephalus solidus TaxID=70667 RepID=A0A0X3P360_SCHSO
MPSFNTHTHTPTRSRKLDAPISLAPLALEEDRQTTKKPGHQHSGQGRAVVYLCPDKHTYTQICLLIAQLCFTPQWKAAFTTFRLPLSVLLRRTPCTRRDVRLSGNTYASAVYFVSENKKS